MRCKYNTNPYNTNCTTLFQSVSLFLADAATAASSCMSISRLPVSKSTISSGMTCVLFTFFQPKTACRSGENEVSKEGIMPLT